MIEVKQLTGKLDLDTSPYKLAKEDYSNALNITKDAVEGSNDIAVTNIVGNRLVNYVLHEGNNICIGAKSNFPKMVYMIWNSLGYHQVLEFDSTDRTITKIFENLTDSDDVDVLGFTENDKINNINIYNRPEGDLLYFLDSLDRPTYMNIARFKAGEYTPVTRDILDVCALPPLSPASCIYGNDTTRQVNNLRNKLFRFKYRWIYDDNQKSVFSPISAVPLPLNILSETYNNLVTNNNRITLQIESGGKDVKAIEIAVSVSNKTNSWLDFASVIVYNKADNSIADDITFSYLFYNDSTYPVIDISESLLLYDYVPPKAQVQEMPNGNVLLYGAITEGYDNDLEPNVVITVNTIATDNSQQGTLSATNGKISDLLLPPRYRYYVNFTGVPAVGTVITIKVQKRSDSTFVTGATYTTLAGDTLTQVRAGLYNSAISLGIFSGVSFSGGAVFGIDFNFLTATYFDLVQVTVTPPALTAASNSIATWKWSTERNIGIVYFDKKGVTNGVVYNSKISFPEYAESVDGILLPYINIKIYNQPPIWAYSYQFLFTKEPTQYLFWQTIDAKKDTDYIYLDVTNFVTNASKNPTTATVLSYSFQDGDRLRLIRNQATDTVYDYTYDIGIEGLVVDPTINGTLQTGHRYIKIKNITPFSTVDFVADKNFVIEIYRVSQQPPNDENQVYYELGQQFPILNPETTDRVHAGSVTNQSIDLATPAETDIYEGDSYFRLRSIFNQATESSSGYANFYCQDRNFLDIYTSAVSSVDGRPNIIDINAKNAYYATLVRFGQAYQANTNINGFNRFFPNDFDEYDYSYGDIVRMKVRDRFIRIFQKYKIGTVPIFNQISKNADGTQLLVVTDKLLNPIQYNVGDFGIGEHAESLASFNFADYFTTNIRGTVCRVSNNGVEPISVLYKINSWASQELPLRTGNNKVYGVFDQKLNNYIIKLDAVGEVSPQITLSFDEEQNMFESFLSFYPEMMCSIGTVLVSFKNGGLYTHDATTYNTFFGTTYDSTINPVFNQNTLEKKTYLAISEVASEVWDCPEIETSLNSYGTTKQQSILIEQDFVIKEGVHHAGFLRDSNSQGGLIEGDSLKGQYISIKFRKQIPTNLVTLNILSLEYIDSPLTKS